MSIDGHGLFAQDNLQKSEKKFILKNLIVSTRVTTATL